MALATVGFHGKLPSHGDFLRRRVSDAFVRVWDDWLQRSIAASHAVLGERWLDVYLTSPVWRFACAPGACGPSPALGVLVPSVDSVGRYFPLTLVVTLRESANVLLSMTAAEPFYQAAEQLAIETLAVDDIDFARFDEQVLALADHLGPVSRGPGVILEPGALAEADSDVAAGWQIPLSRVAGLSEIFQQLLSSHLSMRYAPLVAWATMGSAVVAPTCLFTRGLPDPASFPAFLDGAWEGHGWRPVPARVNEDALAPGVIADDGVPVYFRSAAASHVGCVRETNQDAFLERPDAGIWAVADGMGGQSHGEVASRMVCNALGALASYANIDEFVSAADERLQQAEEELWRAVGDHPELNGSGSTVVALLARAARCAVLWAGDSRAYRWRGGRLEQLTRDHTLAGVVGTAVLSSVITRAVGGSPGRAVDLDVLWDAVKVGDRFLLCSDGLTGVLSDDVLRGHLESPNIHEGVQGLIRQTLEAGAPDNVTALIIEAYGQEPA